MAEPPVAVSPETIAEREQQVAKLEDILKWAELSENLKKREGTLFPPIPAEVLEAAAAFEVALKRLGELTGDLEMPTTLLLR